MTAADDGRVQSTSSGRPALGAPEGPGAVTVLARRLAPDGARVQVAQVDDQVHVTVDATVCPVPALRALPGLAVDATSTASDRAGRSADPAPARKRARA